MNYPIGIIKSLEPLSISHGNGMRFVVFLTDEESSNNLKISSIDLITKILKYKNYFVEGGVTFKCDKLNQKEFLISCLKFLKNCGINTCIETKDFDYEIMSLADIIL